MTDVSPKESSLHPTHHPTLHALIAGGIAGMSVDVILFPLDTLKTRLQSVGGKSTSGGYKKLYSGLSSVLVGSIPSAALFFGTYEYTKKLDTRSRTVQHMIAATLGEIVACLIRVPTEVVKQRMQARLYFRLDDAVKSIYKNSGIRGFYQGFYMTVFREIPFTCIQFPFYEFLKGEWMMHYGDWPNAFEAGICGSVAGATAAALTTPLDVVKTRIMLSKDKTRISSMFYTIYTKEGIRAFFKGIGPRVTWISIGGFIFLGAYEGVRDIIG